MKSTKFVVYLFSMLMIGTLLIGCAGASGRGETGDTPEPTAPVEKPADEPAGSELDQSVMGITWVLQSALQPLLPDSVITIEFQADGQISGLAGCNSYFGSLTVTGDALSVGPLGSTEMWCEGLMDQETAFLQALQSADGLTLAGDSLSLHTPDGDLVFAPAENAALEGTVWTLTAIAQKEGVVSTRVDAEITIQFADGQVTGNGGCNQFSGSYQVEDGTLTLGQIGATLMSCDEEHNQREAEFLAALGAVAGYRTEMKTLFLTDADGRDLLFFTAGEAVE